MDVHSENKDYETLSSDESIHEIIPELFESVGIPRIDKYVPNKRILENFPFLFSDHSFKDRRIIGSSGQAVVYTANHPGLNRVCVKAFSRNLPRMQEEISVIQRLIHMCDHRDRPHVHMIKLHGIVADALKPVGYVMEFVEDGTLSNRIYDPSEEYNAATIYKWFQQISDAVAYLHSRNILHRDIKPSNIFLSHQSTVLKLGDFGLAQRLELGIPLQTPAGTWEYMAPEVLNNDTLTPLRLALKSDVYSLGITFWEIFFRRRPIDPADADFLSRKHGKKVSLKYWIQKIIEQKWRPDVFDVELNTIFNRLWSASPELRPSAQEVSDFFNKYVQSQIIHDYPEQSHDTPHRTEGCIKDIHISELKNVEKMYFFPPADRLKTEIFKASHPTFGTVIYKRYLKKLSENVADLAIAQNTDNTVPNQEVPCASSKPSKRLWTQFSSVLRAWIFPRTVAMSEAEEEEKNKKKTDHILVDSAKNEERRILGFPHEMTPHRNIKEFCAYVVDSNNHTIGTLSEYMTRGTSFNDIFSSKVVNIERVKSWTMQLARTLCYYHTSGIVHRGVEADNILIYDNWRKLKLSYCKLAEDIAPHTKKRMQHLYCAAPETIVDSRYSYKSDVYGFAMFIYFITHQKKPFFTKKLVKPYFSESIAFEWASIEVPYVRQGMVLETADSETNLLDDERFFQIFLQTHNDDLEDDFRPRLDMERVRNFLTGELDRICYMEQDEFHLKLLFWLMKECWRTDQERRPSMRQIVELLRFHFAPPLGCAIRSGEEVILQNYNYDIYFNLLPANEYEFEVQTETGGGMMQKVVRPAHEKKIVQGLLKHSEPVDIGFTPLLGTRQQLICQYTKQTDTVDPFAKDWKTGLVTFVLDFDNVPRVPADLSKQESPS